MKNKLGCQYINHEQTWNKLGCHLIRLEIQKMFSNHTTNLTGLTTNCSEWPLKSSSWDTTPCLYSWICLCDVIGMRVLAGTGRKSPKFGAKIKNWPEWSMVGQIVPNKRHSYLFLRSFQLDCHHQVDLYPKLGNMWLLSMIDDLSVVRPVDLMNSIWLSNCVKKHWCNTQVYFLAYWLYEAMSLCIHARQDRKCL